MNNDVNPHLRLREASFDLGEVPQLVIDADGILLMANRQAREIIFYLDPELTGGIEEAFRIPFSGVTLVPREDSVDLHLNEAQTESLARWAAR